MNTFIEWLADLHGKRMQSSGGFKSALQHLCRANTKAHMFAFLRYVIGQVVQFPVTYNTVIASFEHRFGHLLPLKAAHQRRITKAKLRDMASELERAKAHLQKAKTALDTFQVLATLCEFGDDLDRKSVV